MKVCVFGLWHLGTVTAACLAEVGFTVTGLDGDASVIDRLRQGISPLFEPGLDDLVKAGLNNSRLSFSTDIVSVADADLVWITFDTPVDDDDRADAGFVIGRIAALFPHLKDGAVVLVSSQLPVGTMAEIEAKFSSAALGRQAIFACSPENLRLGKAIEVFRHPERVVVGLRSNAGRNILSELFAPFSNNIIWVGTEAAEMVKHATNAFLATCVTFINEIATICENVNADAREVERALRSEPRIGQNAYIRPGGAFAGGTLARDVMFLQEIAGRKGLPLNMIGSILLSNQFHRDWPFRKLKEKLGNLSGRKIAMLGLAYKVGTDTLRRSAAVELAGKLAEQGAMVSAFDPVVKDVSETRLAARADSIAEALMGADALVVMTEWPEFRSVIASDVKELMRSPKVFDQNAFLENLSLDPAISYYTIGRPRF